jgi:hypothetical protein
MDADEGLAAGSSRRDLVHGDLWRTGQEASDPEARPHAPEEEARQQADDDAQGDEPEGDHGGMVAQDSERPGGTVTIAWALM